MNIQENIEALIVDVADAIKKGCKEGDDPQKIAQIILSNRLKIYTASNPVMSGDKEKLTKVTVDTINDVVEKLKTENIFQVVHRKDIKKSVDMVNVSLVSF